jgi:glycosyltransferase involved in cell wall biosynthesis
MLLYITRYIEGAHGTAKSSRDLLMALLAGDERVQVVCPDRCSAPSSAAGFKLGVPEWVAPPPRRAPFPRWLGRRFPRKLMSWAKGCVQWRQFRQSLGVHTDDLIIINGWASHDFSVDVRSGMKARQILVVRESPRHFDGGDSCWTRDDLMRGMKSYWGFIFVSDRCRKDWMSIPAFSRKPAFYVPNCCQEEEASVVLQTPKQEVRRKLKLPADRFLVACVANIERRKGQDIVLDQMPKLVEAIPKVLILFMGASTSKYGTGIMDRIKASPLAGGMMILPEQKSAMEFIYAADALLLPSRAEALPRVVLEAMALGTPVVGSDVDGMPELVEHGRSGFLFSHECPLDLVEGLKQISRDSVMASAMACCARERYWANFSRAHQISRYRQVISDLRNGKEGDSGAAGRSGLARD